MPCGMIRFISHFLFFIFILFLYKKKKKNMNYEINFEPFSSSYFFVSFLTTKRAFKFLKSNNKLVAV